MTAEGIFIIDESGSPEAAVSLMLEVFVFSYASSSSTKQYFSTNLFSFGGDEKVQISAKSQAVAWFKDTVYTHKCV